MRFGVLGPLAVWTDDGRPVRVAEPKVRALLADLLVTPGHPVPADRLIEDLWGAHPPGNPVNTLQTKVSQLRRALEAAQPGARELLTLGPAGYRLAIAADAVDGERFAGLVEQARATAGARTRVALLADALALWRGPAFADVADDGFARPAADRLEELRLTALEEQAAARLELGEHAVLADELTDLVARHPLRERLRAAHLRALYRAGRQGEALDSYADLRTRLADELGVDPGPEVTGVFQQILAQDPALAGTAAPATSAARARGNLPAALTALIGREDDVAQVRASLQHARLVTLTGIGGVGKTRLALEVAGLEVAGLEVNGAGRAGGGRAADGGWLVELAGRAPSSGPLDVADAVGAVLGLRDEPAPAAARSDPIDRLADALSGREVLLVLDNCEHVIDAVAVVAQRLLRAAPGLRILATSREPLAVSGEVVHALAPLAVPAGNADPAALQESAAVRLFVERATAAAPGFRLDTGNAPAVAAICRRLDGIPLALELAAGRVRMLGVRELARRMDDRFRVLGGMRRDAPARQRTLRAVLDWSWELLAADEQAVLRRLSVPPDGAALDVATALGADPGPADRVLDVLDRLIQKSLVVVVDEPDGPRYRLLESVAAYAAERLHEAGERGTARRRYAELCADLAERARPHLHGPDQRRWLQRLDAESAGLRHALDVAVELGDGLLTRRLVDAQAWSWFLRGRHHEAYRALDAALSVPAPAGTAVHARAAAWRAGFALLTQRPDAGAAGAAVLDAFDGVVDPVGRARAAGFLASAHVHFGDISLSRELADAALAGTRVVDDRWGHAAALVTRATQALFRGDLTAVRHDSDAALAGFSEVGDRWGQAQAMSCLSHLAQFTGDYDAAARLHREALRSAEELGLWSDVSRHLAGLGRIALLRGDDRQAEELHRRALRLAVEQSDTAGQEHAEIGLGLLARRRHRFADAEAHLGAWLDWNRRLGSDIGSALILAELGFVAEQRGDAATALARHREGLAAARRTGDPRATALAFEGLAGALSLTGEAAGAARLLGAAAALRDATGAPLPPNERADVDRISARLREVLGPAEFAAAQEAGRALDAAELAPHRFVPHRVAPHH